MGGAPRHRRGMDGIRDTASHKFAQDANNAAVLMYQTTKIPKYRIDPSLIHVFRTIYCTIQVESI